MAVHPGYKAFQNVRIFPVLFRLSAVYGISNYIVQTLAAFRRLYFVSEEPRIGGFVWVLDIDHHLAKPTIDTPNRCDRHYYRSMGRGHTTASVICFTAV